MNTFINEEDVKYSHVIDKLLWSITQMMKKVIDSDDKTKRKLFDVCATMGMEYIKFTAGEENLNITMRYYEQKIVLLHKQLFMEGRVND